MLGNAAIERKIFLRAFPPKNWEALIEREYINVGGSGAHSAGALSSLGFKTHIVTQVGKDDNGNRVLSELKKTRVDLEYVLCAGSATSSFISAFDESQDRIMFIRSVKWNEKALFSRLRDSLKKCEMLVICPSSAHLVMRAAQLAKTLKKPIIISPQAAFFKQDLEWIEQFFRLTDMIFLNESEMCTYARVNSLNEAIERLRFTDDQIVVVTRGVNGCTVILNKKAIHRPAKHGTVVDPSGAGDSFMAGFIWGLEKGESLKKAADIGSIAGLATSTRTELSEKCLSLQARLKKDETLSR